MPWSDAPPPSSGGWSDEPPAPRGATHTTSGAAGELPTPPDLSGIPGSEPAPPEGTYNPMVGEYRPPGGPTAVDQALAAAGKIPAGLVGGAAQIAQSITPFANQYPKDNPLARYATKRNPTWWGTLGETLGGLPLGATDLPAAVVGGVMATPSGSAASHLGGVAAGELTHLPFRGISTFSNWLRQRAATRAATITKDQAPQAAMRLWMQRALKGTGLGIPRGDITPSYLTSVTDQVGGRLEELNRGMTLETTPELIARMKGFANQVASKINDPKQAANWNKQFEEHVLRPLTVGKTDVPIGAVTGEKFGTYVKELRNLARDNWKHSPVDPYGDDKDMMGDAFREFADRAEDLSTGANKALRDRTRQSYAQIMTLNRAAAGEKHSIASPKDLSSQVIKELGNNDAAFRKAQAREPEFWSQMDKLQRIHESPEAPRIGGGRAMDVAHNFGPGAAASYLATLAANHALGHPLGSYETFLPAWAAMHAGIGDPAWQNVANYAARLAGRGARAAGRGAGAVPGAYAGLVGARGARAIEDAANQSPTGGVSP